MRAMRLLLAASFSLFLLALSFALVTGRVWQPAEARAQTSPQFVGIVQTYYQNTSTNGILAITADGGLYGFTLGGWSPMNAVSGWSVEDARYIGSLAVGPVPADASSWGGLKVGGKK